MKILDGVLRKIEAQVAAHPVERGGALLGPRGSEIVTEFLYDAHAETTGASYSPSRELDAKVRDLEQREGFSLKGILHSHPGSFDRPSGQDIEEFRIGLDLNPHMSTYLAPIVTHPRQPGPDGEHVTRLPSGMVTWYAARRTSSGNPSIRACPVTVVPLLRDLEAASSFLGGGEPGIISTQLGRSFVPAGVIPLHEGAELLVIAGGEYPLQRPLLLMSYPGSGPEPLDVPWHLDVPEKERLVSALRHAFSPPGPYRPLHGLPGGPALTEDPGVARMAGWGRVHAAPLAEARVTMQDGLFARSAGLLSRSLADRTVLVVGLGSVGSYMAEQLVRSGVGRVALVDPEEVEAANLSRTVYDVRDVGTKKAHALARRLLNVSPSLHVESIPDDLLDLGTDGVDQAVQGCDLVVAATDDPAAQRILSRFAYGRGKPAVFVALYPGAQGGEVVVTVPGATPCFVCSTGSKRGPAPVGRRWGGPRLRDRQAAWRGGARGGHPARGQRGREARAVPPAAAGRRGQALDLCTRCHRASWVLPHAFYGPGLLVLPAGLRRGPGPRRLPGALDEPGIASRMPGVRTRGLPGGPGRCGPSHFHPGLPRDRPGRVRTGRALRLPCRRKHDMTNETLEVLEWARATAKQDDTVRLFWSKLCDAVSEPESASAGKVLAELGEYGGSTIVNIFRGSGVEYPEVATDVAEALDGWFGDGAFTPGDIYSCESFVLEKMEVDAESMKALCEAVRGATIERAIVAEASKATAKVAAYGVARRVAQEAAKRLAARAAAETGKRVAQKVAAQVVARIVAALNIAFAAWAVVDLAGPASRVTIPGVTYVALLRRLHEGATNVDLNELRKAVGA